MKLTYLKQNYTQLILIALTLTLVCSCGTGTSKQSANAEGFTNIEQELNSKFGKNAYYTDLSISYDATIGNMISVTVTEDPESLKMEQWINSQDSWEQTSEITLEVPQGSKAADFMFQLNDAISLSQLGALVANSCDQLKSEKNIENPTLSIAHVKFPKNGEFSKAEYAINLKPENGGTTFRFYYKLNGELIKMDY
ncbi:hypothetical protein [Psychroserpens mesophilus]|uniref:hypothetical protein n=1 Tax=Psychroserpens mesophilus TaxID=325473 RepID=UPI00058D48FF|nr:hypothetical protein [Psychroserpens mesophilus]